MKTLLILIVSVTFMLLSCSKNTEKRDIITQRIQYEVLIKSPNPDFDWWVQNIEGQQRETFLKTIISKTTQSEVKAYDDFGKTLTAEQLQNIIHRVDTVWINSDTADSEPVAVEHAFNINDISALSFIEEWQLADNAQIEKRIIGYAPLISVFDADGDFRGFKPLFWLYFDKAYPETLNNIGIIDTK